MDDTKARFHVKHTARRGAVAWLGSSVLGLAISYLYFDGSEFDSRELIVPLLDFVHGMPILFAWVYTGLFIGKYPPITYVLPAVPACCWAYVGHAHLPILYLGA